MKETLHWVEITEKNQYEVIALLDFTNPYCVRHKGGKYSSFKRHELAWEMKENDYEIECVLLPIKQEVVTESEIATLLYKTAKITHDSGGTNIDRLFHAEAKAILELFSSRMTQQPKQEEESEMLKCRDCKGPTKSYDSVYCDKCLENTEEHF